VVVLHDIEGFSYHEIAEIVGTSVGTVRSRLHYGRTKLRELLEPYFEQRNIAPASR
jgi:RNA polymerase sigma-70 factor (ECF subfamily)